MQTNALPEYDRSDNPTGCCPRFAPEEWDAQDLHFRDKPFVRARTRSIAHVPVNMGSVFSKTYRAIRDAHAEPTEAFAVLSRDESAWSAEHLFAVTKEVPGLELVKLSGDYITKVFEGPYKTAPQWEEQMAREAEARGREATDIYFFYTTCPKCAKAYGKNYVVAIARLA